MQPTYPVSLHANVEALAALEDAVGARSQWLWDERRALSLSQLADGHVALHSGTTGSVATDAFLFKLLALGWSRYERTVFLDCDVFVEHHAFIDGLLVQTLAVADVAMPIDPGREAKLTYGRDHAAWVFPMTGPPMLCTAVLAYRRSPSVDALWSGAARRLVGHWHHYVRQSDQEMIWFEWTRNRTDLRVLALPEECVIMGSPQAAPGSVAERRTIDSRVLADTFVRILPTSRPRPASATGGRPRGPSTIAARSMGTVTPARFRSVPL